MATKKNLPLDEFVQAIRPDPAIKGETLKVICGFLGKSSEKESIRVYFDEALNQFVDFKESDIVHAVKFSREESALGGCKLWIRNSATYTYGDPEKKEDRPKAQFLQGALTQGYQPGPDGPNLPPDLTIQTHFGGCFTRIDPGCGHTVFNPPCHRTVFNPPCNVTTLRASCLGPTCYNTCFAQRTCLISCGQPSCFVTCGQTCLKSICNNTCLRPTCFHITCHVCQVSNQICVTELATYVCHIDPQTGQVPPIQGTGFEDFNPLAGM